MKKILLMIIALSMLLCIVGCSNRMDNDSYVSDEYVDKSFIGDNSVSKEDGYTGSQGNQAVGSGDKLVIDGISSGDSWWPSGSSNSNSNSNSSNKPSVDTGTLPSVNDQTNYVTKLIKNFTIQSETQEFDKAIASLQELIASYNGYIENSSVESNTYTNYSKKTAKYSIRIPSDVADEFVNSASGLLHITNSTSNVTDISLEYYTMQRKQEILEGERTALQAMLEKANSTSEILSLRERLNNILQEIGTLETKLAVYDSQVSYSTIKLNVYEVVHYTVVEEEPTFWEKIGEAISGSWNNFVDGAVNFIIWFIYAIPALIIISGLLTLVLVLYFKAKRLGNNNTNKSKFVRTRKQKKKTDKTDNSNDEGNYI